MRTIKQLEINMVLTIQKVIGSFHHVTVEEPVLLDCCAMWLGNFFPILKEVYQLHIQVICQFTASGITYSTTRCNNPKAWLLNMITGL
jgi:hypothetical protein